MAMAALRHARITYETTKHDPHLATLELRGQICKYRIGVRNAAALRDKLVRVENLEQIEALLLPIIEEPERIPALN